MWRKRLASSLKRLDKTKGNLDHFVNVVTRKTWQRSVRLGLGDEAAAAS